MKTNSLKRNNFITLVTGSEFTQKAILEQLRKYISDDIVGKSEVITKTKDIALKLAKIID